jgi:anti-sigma factor RsiW
MLDDLRNSLMDPYDEEEVHEEKPQRQAPKASRSSSDTFMGMTAAQRFIVALMVLMMVCLLGAFFLLVTGKIALPI